MHYEMEDLVPVVAKLAEKYTACESSSITYEKAEQLMEAVLYCIHEAEEMTDNALTPREKIPAQRAYEMGAAYVVQKVQKALALYNNMLPEFDHYENQCLYDTFVKGLPEFFQWYDSRFVPQNTILTLDYPVLKDLSEYTGIDKIFEFIKCISIEQKFLHLFPENYVTGILSKYDKHWKESLDNICERVLTYVLGHVLADKSLTERSLDEAVLLVKNYCGNDEALLNYLTGAIRGIVIRLNNASDNKALRSIL